MVYCIYVTVFCTILAWTRSTTTKPDWCTSLRPASLNRIRPQNTPCPFHLDIEISAESPSLKVIVSAIEGVHPTSVYLTALDKMENKLGDFIPNATTCVASCGAWLHKDVAYVVNGTSRSIFHWVPSRRVTSVLFVATVIRKPKEFWVLKSDVLIPTPTVDSSEENRVQYRSYSDVHTLKRQIAGRRHVPFLILMPSEGVHSSF